MGIMKSLSMDMRGPGRGGQGQFARVKSMFFDRPAVQRMMSDRTRETLSHFGALTMRIARNSIRSRDAISSPGQPPSSHVGAENRRIRKRYQSQGLPPPKMHRGIKEIYYSFDPLTRSVVIGPIRFNSSELAKTSRRVGQNVTTLELLEYGGTAYRQVVPMELGGETFWVHSPGAPVTRCTYRPRPFMGPAYDTALDKLPQMWG